MTYDNFMVKISNKLDRFPIYGGDYIIEFKARIDSDDKYERFIEILTLDPQINSLIWLNDWREGHDDIILEGIYDIGDLVDCYRDHRGIYNTRSKEDKY